MNITKRVYTSGFIAALLATSSLTADGIRQKLTTIGLTSHDVRFSKNESDHLEVVVMSEQAMDTISKMETLPTLDAPEADSRFMKQHADKTWSGTATYEGVIASLRTSRQPSHEKWTRIVNDLVTGTTKLRSMPKTASTKTGVIASKIAETA
jgi:hypothetical protein